MAAHKTPASVEPALRRLAARRIELESERAANMRETQMVVRRGRAAGLQKVQLAEWAGISRPTLDALLRD